VNREAELAARPAVGSGALLDIPRFPRPPPLTSRHFQYERKETAVPPPAESKPFLPVEMERGDSAPVLYRNTTVEPEDFTDENTFQIAISSEYPGVQRASAAHENLGIAKAGELFTEV